VRTVRSARGAPAHYGSFRDTHRARHGGYVLLRGEHTLFSLVAGAVDASAVEGNSTIAHAEYAAFMRSLEATPASERVLRGSAAPC
jgi:hypothetical protein